MHGVGESSVPYYRRKSQWQSAVAGNQKREVDHENQDARIAHPGKSTVIINSSDSDNEAAEGAGSTAVADLIEIADAVAGSTAVAEAAAAGEGSSEG